MAMQIYEFPGGAGWLVDDYRSGGQYQLTIPFGRNIDKSGATVEVLTMADAKLFYKSNKAYLDAKMSLLGKPGKQDPASTTG